MIDHTYKTIFIHQRKCAGASIITSFGCQPQNEEWGAFNDGVLSSIWSERDPAYFVFAVVRNPFDRLLSGWKYLPSTPNGRC